MKNMTVRLPEPLVAEIEAESRARKISKSDVVRGRLTDAKRSDRNRHPDPLSRIADLIGSLAHLPSGMSAHRKRALQATGYGKKRPR